MLSISKILQNSSSCSVFQCRFCGCNFHGNLGETFPPHHIIIHTNGTTLNLKTLSVAPGRKLVIIYTFVIFLSRIKTQLCKRFSKLNVFLKIVSKMYIILYIINIYRERESIFCFLTFIRIRRRNTWPFFYENSAKTRWILVGHSTAASVTAKLLRCIRISFPSLGGLLGGWPKDPKKMGDKIKQGKLIRGEISIKNP